jgi:hypothetical protein
MSAGGPRRIGDLLQFGDIGRLRAEAAERRELAGQGRAALPSHEAAHIASAHLNTDGQIVVGVDSAAWAARLRYSTQELLGKPIRVQVAAPGAIGD